MDNILQAKDITKQVGNNLILNGVSIDIPRGIFLSIIGTSGSGKSTLLYVLGLLDEPSSGEIIFEKEEIDYSDKSRLSAIRNRKIGFVFQFHYLIDELTAAENIMLPVMKLQKDTEKARHRAHKLLEQVGLKGKEKRKPYQLSGGEQQRVAIARALANEPAIIMADEPTGNLDKKNSEIVMDLILELNRKQTSVLMVTHDLDLAAQAEKTLVISDGIITGYNTGG